MAIPIDLAQNDLLPAQGGQFGDPAPQARLEWRHRSAWQSRHCALTLEDALSFLSGANPGTWLTGNNSMHTMT